MTYEACVLVTIRTSQRMAEHQDVLEEQIRYQLEHFDTEVISVEVDQIERVQKDGAP